MDFKKGHPLLKSTEPDNSYFLFIIDEWEEKIIGNEKFVLLCMEGK